MKGNATPKLDRIKTALVGLKMPRALEIVDDTVGRLERGELSALEAIDTLLAEELAVRESRRVRIALTMARLTPIKTLAGFDFTFQPSLDRERILALAELGFVDRCEAVHLLGPPGTGKSHLATALGVEAVKAGRSVYFATLADIIGALTKVEREGRLREKIRFFCRAALLIVDAVIESDKTAQWLEDEPPEKSASMEEVAEAIKYLHGQSPRGWTHELQITPSLERWVP